MEKSSSFMLKSFNIAAIFIGIHAFCYPISGPKRTDSYSPEKTSALRKTRIYRSQSYSYELSGIEVYVVCVGRTKNIGNDFHLMRIIFCG